MRRNGTRKIISFLLACSLILPMMQVDGLIRTVSAVSGITEATYETTENYTHTIYANGMPLLIVATEHTDYAKLYIDANGNGTGDAGEEITGWKGDGTLDGGGIYYSDLYKGYFLANTTVYGGSKEGNCRYDTSVTLSGATDPSDGTPFTLRMICGGNKNGSLEGSTRVNISGGNVRWVFGGGNGGTVDGSTAVNVTGGFVAGNLYGGGVGGNVTGNTSVNIQGGVVSSVFGGNENHGSVEGDTCLTFGEGAVVKGWVYGGGAGYNDSLITEVAGSTNIIIHGGVFSRNIHGGGGWRGAKAGNTNITIHGGKIEGDVYGGGEEQSVVTGTASITVNGGEMLQVAATGAGWNDTEAVVENARIRFNGGSVDRFLAFGENEGAILNGDLSFSMTGDSFSKTSLWFGDPGDSKSFQNLSVFLKDGKAEYLYFWSPVRKNLNISFDRGEAGYFYMADGILAGAGPSALVYENCGSADNRWGEYDIFYSNLSNGENPLFSYRNVNNNRFTSIRMKNSYINFLDTSTWNEDRGLQALTEKLEIDGGALRIAGVQTSYMPDTTFKNHPLLLRTSDSMACFDRGVIHGAARIAWLDRDGAGSAEDKSLYPLVCGVSENPDQTFASADEMLCLKTNTIWSHEFSGKAWYAGTTEKFCRCSVYGDSGMLSAVPGTFPTIITLPAGSGEKTVTLRDTRWDSTGDSDNCPVVGHRGTVSEFEYALISEGTTSVNPVLNGDRLTVYGPGRTNISVTQKLNGKSYTYRSGIYAVEIPAADSFTYTIGMCEDLFLEFKSGAMEDISGLWDKTNHQWVDESAYTMTVEDGTLYVTISREYLGTLEEGSHMFDIGIYLEHFRQRYEYEFTVNIVQPKEVTEPVIECSGEPFRYDGTAKIPRVTVKDGDTVIPSDEYEVRYENNINAGTARIIITDKEGGNYIVNGTAFFEIINDYRPKNGTDYTVNRNIHGWTNTDFEVTAKEGYLLSCGNTLADTWKPVLSVSGETAAALTFYVRNLKNGEISLAVTERCGIDTSGIESYDIIFNGSSVVRSLEEISFKSVYDYPVKVEITADDTLSGTDSISYFISETVLNEEQLKNVTQWTEGRRFTLNEEDGKKFIIYVKAADRAGNILYYGSEGAEFDLSAPVISGVTDGSTCYTTQTVTVTDRNLSEITVNGEKVENCFLLNGNTDKTYVIIASDRAGNETKAVVTMKPVSCLADVLAGITPENVTADDRPVVEALIRNITDLSAEEYLTSGEMKALEQIKVMASRLAEMILEAETAVRAEEIATVKDISADTVRFADESALEKAKNLLEKALKNYGGNYTDEEKQAAQDELLRIQKALESLKRVRELQEMIYALPDGENAGSGNMDIESAVRRARELYDSLTGHEKSLAGAEAEEKLERLLAILNDGEHTDDENKKESESENNDHPETGDTVDDWRWFSVMLVSAGILGGRSLYRRKKQGDR